jgi:hypothetical protein
MGRPQSARPGSWPACGGHSGNVLAPAAVGRPPVAAALTGRQDS